MRINSNLKLVSVIFCGMNVGGKINISGKCFSADDIIQKIGKAMVKAIKADRKKIITFFIFINVSMTLIKLFVDSFRKNNISKSK